MLSTIAFVARNPALRIYALLMFVASSAGAATFPYRSLMGISVLGMSEQFFSVMSFVATVSSLIFGVSIGIISDFITNRRALLLATGLMGALGFGLIWMFPSVWMMAFTTIFILPFSNTNPMIYTGVRNATSSMPSGEAAAVNSVVRTSMSAAWVGMPFFVGVLIASRSSTDVTDAFAVSLGFYCIVILVVLFVLPRDTQRSTVQGGKSGFFKALRELGQLSILLRLIVLAALCAGNWLQNYTMSLVVLDLGGSLADTGFIAGGIALLEIPFMLLWAAALKRYGAVPVLIAGAVIYAVYLGATSLVWEVWQYFALIPVAGLGAASILSVPLSYFQDLFPERPGLGTSLYPLHGFVGTGIASLIFGVGSQWTDYQGVNAIGAILTLVAVVLLIGVERFLRLPVDRDNAVA